MLPLFSSDDAGLSGPLYIAIRRSFAPPALSPRLAQLTGDSDARQPDRTPMALPTTTDLTNGR